ncbi:MAG: hypothetical protein C0520_08635 [Sphingopyxis sp.]|nr:hypothetical protein [Sphingopyxis sp.]
MPAAVYAVSVLLLAWVPGGQALLGRVDAALAIPLLMPGALLFAWLAPDGVRGRRWSRAGGAILMLLAAQAALHLLLAGRLAAGQLLSVAFAGVPALFVAGLVRRRTRGWPRLARWFVFVLVIALWFAGGQALNAFAYVGRDAGVARQRVVMLTSLPLRWGGGSGDLAHILAEGPADLPALTEIGRTVDLQMVDTLGGNLPAGATLFLAHPAALSPHDLVRIDDHRRRGGRIVILADALSSWPPPHPLGDPRNPPVTSLLTPLLDHWGIELAAPAPDGAGEAALYVDPDGTLVRLHSAGRFVRLPPQCRALADAHVARCDGGRLWLVGDADMLHADLWRSPVGAAPWLRRADNLAWLVDVLRGRPGTGFRPLWIRARR